MHAGSHQRTSATMATQGSAAGEFILDRGLEIEGTIAGVGHIRIVGRLTGDVTIDGDLVIESGGKVVGDVSAHVVTVGGELEGSVEDATSVKLLSSGTFIGSLTAASLTVADGARMRSDVQFGWVDQTSGS